MTFHWGSVRLQRTVLAHLEENRESSNWHQAKGKKKPETSKNTISWNRFRETQKHVGGGGKEKRKPEVIKAV